MSRQDYVFLVLLLPFDRLVETIPLCQGLVFATRLDKGPESMLDGMGCHLPMKLREQNSELNLSGQRTRRPSKKHRRSKQHRLPPDPYRHLARPANRPLQ